MLEPEKAYNQLIELLHRDNVPYRLIDHEPQGQTEIVSRLRGNSLSQAAKCMILMVKVGKKEKHYVLGVVTGDARVDFNAIKELFGASYVSFASANIAEELAGSVAGTILPFSFRADLELIADPALLDNQELYFNAGRLDRSLVIKTTDYVKLAHPRFERISTKENCSA